jgi:hypothetical protein
MVKERSGLHFGVALFEFWSWCPLFVVCLIPSRRLALPLRVSTRPSPSTSLPIDYFLIIVLFTACDGIVGWDSAPQTGRLQFRFPMEVTVIFDWRHLSGRIMVLRSIQPLTEISGDEGGRSLWLTTLPPSYADFIEILGASNSWSSKGFPRPVMRQLFLLTIIPFNAVLSLLQRVSINNPWTRNKEQLLHVTSLLVRNHQVCLKLKRQIRK